MNEVCAVCVVEDDLESHHIAGRTNNATATLQLCSEHHSEQTDMQWRFGVISRRKRPRSDLRTFHGLTEGLAGILGAHANHIGNQRLVAAGDLARRATLDLIALLALFCDERVGSRPILNDRRERTNRKRRPRNPSINLAESAAALAAGIFPALADVIVGLVPGTEEAALAERLAAGAEQFAHGLTALENGPRAHELQAASERAMGIGRAAMQEVASAIAAGGLDSGHIAPQDQERLARVLESFYVQARAHVSFASALAAGEDATVALDRLLTEPESTFRDQEPSA
jgi:hypothetical protein